MSRARETADDPATSQHQLEQALHRACDFEQQLDIALKIVELRLPALERRVEGVLRGRGQARAGASDHLQEVRDLVCRRLRSFLERPREDQDMTVWLDGLAKETATHFARNVTRQKRDVRRDERAYDSRTIDPAARGRAPGPSGDARYHELLEMIEALDDPKDRILYEVEILDRSKTEVAEQLGLEYKSLLRLHREACLELQRRLADRG